MKKVLLLVYFFAFVEAKKGEEYDPTKSDFLKAFEAADREFEEQLAIAKARGLTRKEMLDVAVVRNLQHERRVQDKEHWEWLQSLKPTEEKRAADLAWSRQFKEFCDLRDQERLDRDQQPKNPDYQNFCKFLIAGTITFICGCFCRVLLPPVINYFNWRLQRAEERRAEKRSHFEQHHFEKVTA